MNRSKIIISAFLMVTTIILTGNIFIQHDVTPQNVSNHDTNWDKENNAPKTSTSGRVLIYVNSTIYDNTLKPAIDQYVLDIQAQGYSVKIINNTMFPNEVLLKTNITSEYNLYGLNGTIFIGEFPYLLFQNNTYPDAWGSYPCDLFFMDLDGLWYDPDGLPPTEGHYNGAGDIYPEIWMSRINPRPLIGCNQTKLLIDYFNRNHQYRTGQLSRSHKAMLYIDDEWSNFATEWISNFTSYIGSSLDAYYTNPNTNSMDYLNKLTSNYELVHLLCHSNETDHLFGMNLGMGQTQPVDGIVNYKNVNNTNTQPLFYNLYACYNGNFTHPNNLGTTYLFSNNTLTVICSSKSGGMDLYQPFYDSLKQNMTIGDAFYKWWLNPDPLATSKYLQKLWYGMTIFGDPLLKISQITTGGITPTVSDDDDDDDDNDKAGTISFGNTFLKFTIITLISMVIFLKRKAIFSKNI